jgi:predicted methyltransferase
MNQRYLKQLIQELIKNKNNKDIWYLIDKNDASLLEFLDLYNKYLKKNKFKIKDTQAKIIKKINQLSCLNCKGSGLVLDKFFKQILDKFQLIIKNRPEALAQYDQAFIQADDVIKRVMFIYQRGDLLNSKILVIGDDDLISIALGLTNLPEIIYVIEIDQRLTSFINHISQKYLLKIKTLTYDVRQPLPSNLLNQFDVFITDPVETEKGLKAFLLRGMLSLKDNGSGYFGLTTLESSLKKWFAIEIFIIKNGFVITDIKRQFSVYPLLEDKKSWQLFEDQLPISKLVNKKTTYEWYKSSFLRIEKVKKVNIKNTKINLGNKFYIDQEALATPQIN